MRIRNINYYLSDQYITQSQSTRQSLKKTQIGSAKFSSNIVDNSAEKQLAANSVHMYQGDIAGSNAIDAAFEKNSIFCIKAFVSSLL